MTRLNLPPLVEPPEEHRYPYVVYVAKVEDRRQIAKALREWSAWQGRHQNRDLMVMAFADAVADQIDPHTKEE